MDRLMLDFSGVTSKTNNSSEIKRERVYTPDSFDNQKQSLQEIGKTREVPKLSFEDILTESVKKVNSLQINAEKKVRDLAIGDVDDISEVVLASSRADTALRLLMEVRNKFLDAYQALSRITG